MLLSFFALRKHLPDLNERDHDERDALLILKRDRVYYRETPLPAKTSGFYLKDTSGGGGGGREYIIINSNLRGAEKLRSQLHETTHHLIDEPVPEDIILMFRSMEVLQTRQEITAEALSLILMFSFPTLEKYVLTGELPEHLFPYVRERLKILNDYGV